MKDCYAALGSIHATWKPVQGRFKDYVAMPKFNLYQSLHTTVVGPQGKPLEVQIRTWEMHARAEQGVAAHWQYKDVDGASAAADVAWLNRIVDWQSETQDPDEFMNNLKIDLEQDEVFVFTPKGKVVTLAAGATPDRLRLRHPHRGRPRVHRRPGQRPARAARLEAVVGRRRGDLHLEGRGRRSVARLAAHRRHAAGRGQDPPVVLPGAARGRGGDRPRGAGQGAAPRGPPRAEAGAGHASSPTPPRSSTTSTSTRSTPPSARTTCRARRSPLASPRSCARSTRRDEEDEVLPTTVRQPRRPGAAKRPPAGVHVEGLDDLMVRLSRCCTPVPGDEILGFVTRGRGVSVHRADCANAVSLAAGQKDRLIEVEWDESHDGTFVAAIEVKALDRGRLLRDVAVDA